MREIAMRRTYSEDIQKAEPLLGICNLFNSMRSLRSACSAESSACQLGRCEGSLLFLRRAEVRV
jgi:hypothetical protein